MDWPVIHRLPSSARKPTICAISSRVPARLPNGVIAFCFSINSGDRMSASSVATSPGLTQLTEWPAGPSSAAQARDIAVTAPLVAQYVEKFGKPRLAAREAMLIIRPGDRRWGITALVIRKTPRTLRSWRWAKSSAVVSVILLNRAVPALLTRMSM